MTKEQEIVRSVFDAYIRDAKANSTKGDRPTFDMLEKVKNRAIKALEQQKPMEKFENAKDHIRKLAGDYKCYDNRLTDEEALELCHILEQQPCDDCVSRAEVLKFVEYFNNPTFIEPMGTLRNMLKDLPPVTPTQRWISVSERFPDPQEDGDSNFTDWVQVSIKINPYQSIVCSAYYCFSEKKWYMERFGCGEVIAWQPLPQPYEEKRGSENGSN